MTDIVCVTASALCKGDFMKRLQAIAKARPRVVILREKQLDEGQYALLAARAMQIFADCGNQLILHNFTSVARSLGATALHLPLAKLLATPREELAAFSMLGASCHSVEDILRAQDAGCTYVTFGNVFATNCKPGLEGKGLEFLSQCCKAAAIPVWAIGGISPSNAAAVRAAGAGALCVMGAFMTCDDPAQLVKQLEGENNAN